MAEKKAPEKTEKPRILAALLAQERIAQENYKARAADLKKTFRDGHTRFGGIIKKYEPIEENGQAQPEDHKRVESTVKSELSWFRDFFKDTVSKTLTREVTNQAAKADLTLFGQTFKDIPAIALVQFETKLKEFKQVLLHLPTLDETKDWETHELERGTYKRAEDAWSYRTEKRPFSLVKAAATDKHPAQVDVVYRDETTGKWTTSFFSGATTINAKAAMLKRCDEAIAAVIEARETANRTNVVEAEQDLSVLYDMIIEPAMADFAAAG